MNNFSELSLSSALRSNLSKHAFVTPTPVQSKAIPPALEGRDVVATAQTGTGKTLAFIVPMVQLLSSQKNGTKGIQALILSPTRELAIQINETFLKLAAGTGLRSAVVVGGLSENTQLRNISQGAQVVIATPGRLCDFLQRKLVRLSGVQMLVLDEADRMLDMGFLPSIQQILKTCPSNRQTLFFSATIEKSVAHLIESHVTDPVRITIGAVSRPVEEVKLHLYQIEGERKLNLLMHLLGAEPQGSFLVFSRTKHGTDRLAKNLGRAGVKAARIHGDRTQAQRNQALDGFKSGNYRVLVATDVAARGIHVDGIAHVVNYDLPKVAEDFVHRVGRTARAGAQGTASTFVGRVEMNDMRRMEKSLRINLVRCDVPSNLAAVEMKPELHVEKEAPAFNRPFAKGNGGRPSGRRSFRPGNRRGRAA